MLQHVNASCSIGALADVAAFRIVHSLGRNVDRVPIVSRSCPDRLRVGATVPARRLLWNRVPRRGLKFDTYPDTEESS